jgi:hypothetical protein
VLIRYLIACAACFALTNFSVYGAGLRRKLPCFLFESRMFKLSGVALGVTGKMVERFFCFSDTSCQPPGG